MKSKILILFITFSIALMVIKFFGYKMLGIEKFVEKREGCVEYSNGGGDMITIYRILEFSKNDVLFYTEDSENLNNGYRKSFKYTKKDDYIYIKINKDDFMLSGLDTLRIFGDTLKAHNVIKFIKQ